MANNQCVLITGCAGLIGSEAVRKFHSLGYEVIGIDNLSRKKYFGDEGNSAGTLDEFFDLEGFHFYSTDITNYSELDSIFSRNKNRIVLVVHTASLPAHESCDKKPKLAFEVNVGGTVNLLECVREHSPNAKFIFLSSSKIYGNAHSSLTYIEKEKRFDFGEGIALWNGIPENYPITNGDSVLGSTKLAADIMVQEYANNYGITTSIWRPGCLTGSSAAGTTEHSYLSYLTRCAVEKKSYCIYGFGGKQVRSIWNSKDVLEALTLWFKKPKKELSIFNIDGSRFSNCSVLEAIDIIQEYTGEEMKITFGPQRKNDHKHWIGSSKLFLKEYPEYKWRYTLEDTIHELIDGWREKLK